MVKEEVLVVKEEVLVVREEVLVVEEEIVTPLDRSVSHEIHNFHRSDDQLVSRD